MTTSKTWPEALESLKAAKKYIEDEEHWETGEYMNMEHYNDWANEGDSASNPIKSVVPCEQPAVCALGAVMLMEADNLSDWKKMQFNSDVNDQEEALRYKRKYGSLALHTLGVVAEETARLCIPSINDGQIAESRLTDLGRKMGLETVSAGAQGTTPEDYKARSYRNIHRIFDEAIRRAEAKVAEEKEKEKDGETQ